MKTPLLYLFGLLTLASAATFAPVRVRLIMFSSADHALASLRESNLTLAIISHASALAIVASKSLARRRLRLSRAMVRSTTQRRGNNLKPLAHRIV